MRELSRFIAQLVRYGIATRRVAVVSLVLSGVVIAAISLTAIKVIPVALYPFL